MNSILAKLKNRNDDDDYHYDNFTMILKGCNNKYNTEFYIDKQFAEKYRRLAKIMVQFINCIDKFKRKGKSNIVSRIGRHLQKKVDKSLHLKVLMVFECSYLDLKDFVRKQGIEHTYRGRLVVLELTRITKCLESEILKRLRKNKVKMAERPVTISKYDNYISSQIKHLDKMREKKSIPTGDNLRNIIKNLKKIFNNEIVKQEFYNQYKNNENISKAMMEAFRVYKK